jgi:hypothetical protein
LCCPVLDWQSATRLRRPSWWAAAGKTVGRAYHSQNSGTIRSKSIWISTVYRWTSVRLPFNCTETLTWWYSLPIVLFALVPTPVDGETERATMAIREGDSGLNICGARWLVSSRHRRWVLVLFIVFSMPNVDHHPHPHPRWRRSKAEGRYSRKKIHVYSLMESTRIPCCR